MQRIFPPPHQRRNQPTRRVKDVVGGYSESSYQQNAGGCGAAKEVMKGVSSGSAGEMSRRNGDFVTLIEKRRERSM